MSHTELQPDPAAGAAGTALLLAPPPACTMPLTSPLHVPLLIHPCSALGEGVEYLLADSQPPHLFILRKMYRHAAAPVSTLGMHSMPLLIVSLCCSRSCLHGAGQTAG